MTVREEAKNCLDAYDRVLAIFKLNNENYFKRTQILMVFMQSALFIAFSKLIWRFDDMNKIMLFMSMMSVSILGIMSAWIWYRLIIKQADYLEFCKSSLRNIECRLVNLGIPLEYFKGESQVFHYGLPHCFRWSGERFPHSNRFREGKGIFSHKVKGRLINIEKKIAFILCLIWIFLFLTIIVLGTETPIKSSVKNWLEKIIAAQGNNDLSVQKVISINPNDAEAYNDLGFAYAVQGNHNLAIESLQKAISIDPEYAKAHYNLALIFSLQKEIELFIQYLRKAIDLDRRFAELVKTDSNFDSIREVPEFQKLINSYQDDADAKPTDRTTSFRSCWYTINQLLDTFVNPNVRK